MTALKRSERQSIWKLVNLKARRIVLSEVTSLPRQYELPAAS
jgi:hypothetical protein